MTEAQQLVTVCVVAALAALGVVALVFGLRALLRSRRLERACTAVAQAVVEDVVDRGPGSSARAPRRKPEVKAANEAIAAKKRAYEAKRRAARHHEDRENLATWHPRVRWVPEGGEPRVTESPRGHRERAFRRGQQVRVRYDLTDPERWYLEAEGTGSSLGPTLMLAGAALVALALVCWFAFPWIASQQA